MDTSKQELGEVRTRRRWTLVSTKGIFLIYRHFVETVINGRLRARNAVFATTAAQADAPRKEIVCYPSRCQGSSTAAIAWTDVSVAEVWVLLTRHQMQLLERCVATKVIKEDLVGSAEAAERFRREARAAASFAHPNVVTIYDFGVALGTRASCAA